MLRTTAVTSRSSDEKLEEYFTRPRPLKWCIWRDASPGSSPIRHQRRVVQLLGELFDRGWVQRPQGDVRAAYTTNNTLKLSAEKHHWALQTIRCVPG